MEGCAEAVEVGQAESAFDAHKPSVHRKSNTDFPGAVGAALWAVFAEKMQVVEIQCLAVLEFDVAGEGLAQLRAGEHRHREAVGDVERISRHHRDADAEFIQTGGRLAGKTFIAAEDDAFVGIGVIEERRARLEIEVMA